MVISWREAGHLRPALKKVGVIMPNETIKLSNLPKNIFNEIPYSLRVFKDEYELDEFPFDIQNLITEYLTYEKDVEYKDLVLDAKPNITKYGDFEIIDNYYDLVIEYFKNFTTTSQTTYPFDPTFGCSLKQHLMKRDTNLRNTLVSNEIGKIARRVSQDLNIPIKIEDITTQKETMTGMEVQYTCIISLLINNTKRKKLTVSSS